MEDSKHFNAVKWAASLFVAGGLALFGAVEYVDAQVNEAVDAVKQNLGEDISRLEDKIDSQNATLLEIHRILGNLEGKTEDE